MLIIEIIKFLILKSLGANNDDSINGYKLEMKLSSDDDSTISTIYEDTNINVLSYTLYQDNNNIIIGNTYYFYISGKNERGYIL